MINSCNKISNKLRRAQVDALFGLPIVSGHCSNTDYWKVDRASPYLQAGTLDLGLRPISLGWHPLDSLRLTAVRLRPHLYYWASPSHCSLRKQESVCITTTDLKGCANIAITRFKSNPPEPSLDSLSWAVTALTLITGKLIGLRPIFGLAPSTGASPYIIGLTPSGLSTPNGGRASPSHCSLCT